ncbi:MAG: hypothetical protein E7374_01685 [Clostridiales bacterium]|nr:hypothetical protein [Clostridiales bacterium]
MSKNLKLSFILSVVLACVVIAWNTLWKFFGGIGLNFIAVILCCLTLLLVWLTDKETGKKMRELFFVSCFFAGLELISYFAVDFAVEFSFKAYKVFVVLQNIYSVIAMLFLGYIVLRLVFEIKGKKLKFVEVINGNEKFTKKPKKEKKAKELENGTLEDKPVNLHEANVVETVENEQVVEEPVVSNEMSEQVDSNDHTEE